MIFFKDGKEVRRFAGATDQAGFAAELNAAFGAGTVSGAGSSGWSLRPVLEKTALVGILAGLGWLVWKFSPKPSR